MNERIPPDRLDPLAVAKANERLWKNNPELRRRQLTMAQEDTAYRKEWMQHYREAEQETPKPPSPKVEPAPVESPPGPGVADSPMESCPLQNMTHAEKMKKAIDLAPLSDEVREELGDLETLVTTMVIVSGTLILLAATGVGAIVELIGAGLLVIGAAMAGWQIGQGINSMIDFYQKTRCDTAKTEKDLKTAGQSFADGIAKMGVGGLLLILALLGGRGKSWRGQKLPAKAARRPGKKGGKMHQKKIKQIQKARKGAKTEQQIKIDKSKNPHKTTRYSDVYDPDTKTHHQVGRTNPKRGDPVSRERKAIMDIRKGRPDETIEFHDYNNPKKPPKVFRPPKPQKDPDDFL